MKHKIFEKLADDYCNKEHKPSDPFGDPREDFIAGFKAARALATDLSEIYGEKWDCACGYDLSKKLMSLGE